MTCIPTNASTIIDNNNEDNDNNSNLTEIECSPDKRYIRFAKVLGRGSYKDVYLCYDNDTGVECAWNCIYLGGLNEHDCNMLRDETNILKSLIHGNIIRLKYYWENVDKREICFISDLMSSGTLKQYINRISHLKLKVIKNWCRQILSALNYLHSLNPAIIHRDIKCDNIFIEGPTGIIKLGDFGLAKRLNNNNYKAESVLGTPEFMAPELYEENYTSSVDIYAFGMCLIEIITKAYPYQECISAPQIWRKVTQRIKPAILDSITDKEIKSFIELCIEFDVNKRPTAQQLLDHPFLNIHNSNPFRDNQIITITNTNTSVNHDLNVQTNNINTNENHSSNNVTVTSPMNRYCARQTALKQRNSSISTCITPTPTSPNESRPTFVPRQSQTDLLYSISPAQTPTNNECNNSNSILLSIQPESAHTYAKLRLQTQRASMNAGNTSIQFINSPITNVNHATNNHNNNDQISADTSSVIVLSASGVNNLSINNSIKPSIHNTNANNNVSALNIGNVIKTPGGSYHLNRNNSTGNISINDKLSMISPINGCINSINAINVHVHNLVNSVVSICIMLEYNSANEHNNDCNGAINKKQVRFSFDFRSDTAMKVATELVYSLKIPQPHYNKIVIATEMENQLDHFRKIYYDNCATQLKQLNVNNNTNYHCNNSNTTPTTNHTTTNSVNLPTPINDNKLKSKVKHQHFIENNHNNVQHLSESIESSMNQLNNANENNVIVYLDDESDKPTIDSNKEGINSINSNNSQTKHTRRSSHTYITTHCNNIDTISRDNNSSKPIVLANSAQIQPLDYNQRAFSPNSMSAIISTIKKKVRSPGGNNNNNNRHPNYSNASYPGPKSNPSYVNININNTNNNIINNACDNDPFSSLWSYANNNIHKNNPNNSSVTTPNSPRQNNTNNNSTFNSYNVFYGNHTIHTNPSSNNKLMNNDNNLQLSTIMEQISPKLLDK